MAVDPIQNWQVYTAKNGDRQIPVRAVTLHMPGNKDGEYQYLPDIRVRLSDGTFIQFTFDDVPQPFAPKHWHVYHYVDDKNRRELSLEKIYDSLGATKKTWVGDEQEWAGFPYK